MPPHLAELSSAELEVLKTLWDDGPATVREVMHRLSARRRKLAYTTVLTFLSRLKQKGFVRADKSDVAYVYQPTVTREKVSKSRLRTLLEELYDGAAAPLVLQLVRDERLSRDDIEQLQQLIEKLDARTKRGESKSSKRNRS